MRPIRLGRSYPTGLWEFGVTKELPGRIVTFESPFFEVGHTAGGVEGLQVVRPRSKFPAPPTESVLLASRDGGLTVAGSFHAQ